MRKIQINDKEYDVLITAGNGDKITHIWVDKFKRQYLLKIEGNNTTLKMTSFSSRPVTAVKVQDWKFLEEE